MIFWQALPHEDKPLTEVPMDGFDVGFKWWPVSVRIFSKGEKNSNQQTLRHQ